MQKIIKLSNTEILIEFAKRKALLAETEQEKINDYNKGFANFLDSYLLENNISRGILENPTIRQTLVDSLRKEFMYVQSPESKIKMDSLKQQAFSVLGENLKTQRWQPDTCGCKVHYLFDATTPELSQSFESEICPDHTNLSLEEVHDTLYVENKRKNGLLREILENFKGIISEDKLDTDGNTVTDLKKGFEYLFSWEGAGKARVLKPSIKGMNFTQSQKTALKNLADSKFGQGKISV